MQEAKNKEILNYFHILKKRGNIGTSYLFVGENVPLVKDIIKLVTCTQDSFFCNRCWDCERIKEDNHPDLFIVQPEPNFIKIERIREAGQFLCLKGFHSAKKILLIRGGDYFSLEAANAFLKTLEEPPQNSFIAIYASKLEGIIPTILSRCRKIFLPVHEEERGSFSSLIANFIKGERVKFRDRGEFALFLRTLIQLLHGYLIQMLTQRKRVQIDTQYGIILKSYTIEELADILKSIINIYSVYNTINLNLALNLIRTKL